jgi:LAO/AO transport system kinase
MSSAALVERVLSGDARAVARAISLIDDDDPSATELVRGIFSRTGRAYLVGVTGPPGAGKSTIVDRLVSEMRRLSPGDARESERGERAANVGVIAVDPTSPFNGGAVLGDRIRMQAHAADERVFIRSMATRGHLGGLSRATSDAALVLDAAGCDVVIIETVGVGQDEVDIVRTADVSVVVLVPGAGDDVQALKAGIMEIADILVVNKADRDGADHLIAALQATLATREYGPEDWRPPILKTVATSGTGIPELMDAIRAFRTSAGRGPAAETRMGRERRRSEQRLREIVARRLVDYVQRHVLAESELEAIVDRIAAREIDPYTAADDLVARALRASTRPVA